MSVSLGPLTNFGLGAAAAAAIAFSALRSGSLDAGGAAMAFAIGTATFGALGISGAAVLLAFFLTSVALSRVGKAEKAKRLVDIGKTGPRDATQVLANGGVAAACALLALALADRHYAIAFAGAFAAATADTWGTEFGTLARGRPRSILTLRPMAIGLSGGVTLPGTLAELAGAMFIALVAEMVRLGPLLPVAVGGIAGALIDSLLGASLQSLRWCPRCRRACETEPHACGAHTLPLRGLSFVNNDAVNLVCTLVGAAVAFWLAPKGT